MGIFLTGVSTLLLERTVQCRQVIVWHGRVQMMLNMVIQRTALPNRNQEPGTCRTRRKYR